MTYDEIETMAQGKSLREFLEGRKRIYEKHLTKSYYPSEEKLQMQGAIKEIDLMLFIVNSEILDRKEKLTWIK